MKRRKMARKTSKKLFRKTAGSKAINHTTRVSRGGIRF